MVKKILKSLGVVLLLLLVYAAVQSVLSIAGIVLSLLYCTSSGLLEGNILDLMQQKISSFPAEAQAVYATGMATALFLSTIVMLVVIHASGLYRIKPFSKPSIGAKPLLYSTVLVFASIFALNIVAAWMNLADNMEQEIGIFQFFQGCVEGIYQMVRQLCDKANGIGQDHIQVIGYRKLPGCGIQGIKQTVVGRDPRSGQLI